MDNVLDTTGQGKDQDVSIDDGTIDGVILSDAMTFGTASLITVGLPSQLSHAGQVLKGGRYFLIRCGVQTIAERAENWQFYLRRPLFVCDLQRQYSVAENDGSDIGFDRWLLLAPQHKDPGINWLQTLGPGNTLNLIGPLGNGFSISSSCRNLLVLAEAAWLHTLLPAINEMLDRNGRVTAIILHNEKQKIDLLLALLPIAVEVHLSERDETWRQIANDTVRWADQICAALPPIYYQDLADIVRHRRFRLEENYAQILVRADLACGYGACLACVVPAANGGVTRACVHGPVLDLVRLV